ncbi:hypothetical protein Q31a_53750 [Aureliella helgolandensis]|uniref:Uncharacterized protein n=1 Tax=Aureliella helgolandensis TaxID=2527968 RepID=A0A518GEH4_9BACT|nr:hypothetical protein Q31a_53750 [Aureliella helgolandensis]
MISGERQVSFPIPNAGLRGRNLASWDGAWLLSLGGHVSVAFTAGIG